MFTCFRVLGAFVIEEKHKNVGTSTVDKMCSLLLTLISSIFTFIVCFAFATIVYAFYVICFQTHDEHLSKTVKIFRFIFIIASMIVIGYYPVLRWQSCMKPTDSNNASKFVPFWNASYGAQIIILSILFFFTTSNAFNGSSFEINKITKNVYKIIYITQGMVIIAVTFIVCLQTFLRNDKLINIYTLLVSFTLLTHILVMISLTILFIHKLIVVYKNTMDSKTNNDEGGHLVAAITKAMILIIISTSITFIHIMLGTFYTSGNSSDSARITAHIIGFCDCYTIFVNAMLCYKAFGSYYNKLCILMDAKCRICWIDIINGTCCYCLHLNKWDKDVNNLQLDVVDTNSSKSIKSLTNISKAETV